MYAIKCPKYKIVNKSMFILVVVLMYATISMLNSAVYIDLKGLNCSGVSSFMYLYVTRISVGIINVNPMVKNIWPIFSRWYVGDVIAAMDIPT